MPEFPAGKYESRLENPKRCRSDGALSKPGCRPPKPEYAFSLCFLARCCHTTNLGSGCNTSGCPRNFYTVGANAKRHAPRPDADGDLSWARPDANSLSRRTEPFEYGNCGHANSGCSRGDRGRSYCRPHYRYASRTNADRRHHDTGRSALQEYL